MVPEGWAEKPLSEIVTIKHGFAFSSEYFSDDGDDVVLTPGSFHEEGGFRDQGRKQKRYSGPVPNGYLLRPGDMLVAMTEQGPGLLGSTLFVPHGRRYLHNQRLGLISAIVDGELDLRYLHRFMSMPDVRKRVSAESGGTKVKHTSPTKLLSLEIPLPPLPEQQKIAEILSTWDKAIQTTEALLANARTQKRALMQSLLTGTRRFPGFEGQPWREVRAGSLFKTVSIKRNGNAPLLSVTQDRGLVRRDEQDRRVAMPDSGTEGYKLVVPGNFVISLRSFQGGLEYSELEGLVSPAYHVLESKKKIHAPFFKHYFKSYEFIGHLAIATIGIRDGRQISFDDFSFMKVPLPEFDEQQRIADAIDLAEAEETACHDSLDHLRTEKKSLMQQLLTGKRRVLV